MTPDYDPLARWFEPLERLCFGPAMQRARTRFHGRFARARTLLVLGPGDGRALPPLLAAAPEARIVAVEPSRRMGERMLARLDGAQRDRVELIGRPWLEVEPELGAFEGVLTDFFLDQFEGAGLARLVERTASHLEPGGLWSVADFQLPERGPERLHARAWLGALYPAFKRLTGLDCRRLEAPGPQLARTGLRLDSTFATRFGLLGTTLWTKCPLPSRTR